MKKLFDYILKLVGDRFYGELTIKFENGKVVHVKETKSFSKDTFN